MIKPVMKIASLQESVQSSLDDPCLAMISSFLLLFYIQERPTVVIFELKYLPKYIIVIP